MFITEAEKVLPKGWDCYSSGGGCYHAMKDFTTLRGRKVAVEVHWSGSAQMYHQTGDANILVNSTQLIDDDNWCNYIELAWLKERYDNENNVVNDYSEYDYTDFLFVFDSATQKEIIDSMITFTKIYDEYHYQD